MLLPHFQFFIYSTIRFSFFAFYKWDNVVCNDINAMNDILMSKEMDYSSMHRSICLKKYHCRTATINPRYNYSLIFIYFMRTYFRITVISVIDFAAL